MHSADDLVQSALERALARWTVLRNPASIRAWLFRILYTTHLNALARRSASEVPTDFNANPELQPEVEETQGDRLELQSVLALLETIPSDQRAAITLTAIEGLSYAQAAQVLDIPVGTLMSRVHRGRRRLRDLTDPEAVPSSRAPALRCIK